MALLLEAAAWDIQKLMVLVAVICILGFAVCIGLLVAISENAAEIKKLLEKRQ